MTDVHLWPDRKLLQDGTLELSATIESAGRKRARLWYRVPADWRECVAESVDPLVVGSLLYLLRIGRDARVRGDVSPSLLANLDEFQLAWSIWRPWKYKRIGLEAEREIEAGPRSEGNRAVCAFSGGVDSAFTALRHVSGIGVRHRLPLKAGVIVHGFDIPLDAPEMFDRARVRAAKHVGLLGLDLIPVITNFRDIDVDWWDAFGAGVASSLMLFQGRYDTGLIAQGDPYQSLVNHIANGSNALTDPLLSSSSFRIVPDGAGQRRIEKIEALSRWPEGLQFLRVCWQGAEKDKNCGRCEKCIRNILTFRALGLGLPPCFPRDVSVEQIRRLRGLKEFTISIGWNAILSKAEETGQGRQPWVRATRAAVRGSRRLRRLRRADPRPLARAVLRRLKRLLVAAAPWQGSAPAESESEGPRDHSL